MTRRILSALDWLLDRVLPWVAIAAAALAMAAVVFLSLYGLMALVGGGR